MDTPVEVLRRVEPLDELLGVRRPRGAVGCEGLAAENLGVVDAQLRGEDLVAQPGLRAGVVVPCLHRRGVSRPFSQLAWLFSAGFEDVRTSFVTVSWMLARSRR